MEVYKIGQLCDINPKTSINLGSDKEISFVPMNAVSVDSKIDTSKSITLDSIKNYTIFKNGDILFAKITPCMENGKGCIADKLKNGYGAGSTEFIVLRPKRELVTQKWIHFFLSQKFFRLHCQQHMTGSAGQKRVPTKFLASCDVPCPSLLEQERIVSRIEELFSQLDTSVAELKTAKERLKVYRQAVLKEAFDSVQDTCEVATIQSVCEDIKVGIVIKPTQYYVNSGGIYSFRNANVRRGFIEDSDWAMISKEGHEKNKRSEVHTGDVLIARSGVNLGMASAVPEKFNGYNAIDVVIAVPKHKCVLSQYLAYYTNSPHGMNSVKANQRGVAQGHLNVTVYGKLPIMLPPLGIQKQVVSKIEEKLSICDGIERTADTALQQAEALRQSILKKAFEGRLS